MKSNNQAPLLNTQADEVEVPLAEETGVESISPVLCLTTSSEADNIALQMSEQLSRERMQRDLAKFEGELQELQKAKAELDERILRVVDRASTAKKALELWYPEHPATALEDFNHLKIVDACEKVFGYLDNRWMPLSELAEELEKHNRPATPASIELALKGKHETFEFEKRGKRNFYRMRSMT